MVTLNDLQPALIRGSGKSDSAERYRLRVQVGILAPDGQARGAVHDMSVSGARIEKVNAAPEEGSKLRLGFAFYAHALPVPIHATVVRRTETGGFAVRFDNVDFRTQILLRSLLPQVSSDEQRPHSDRVRVSSSGYVEAHLSPQLLDACTKLAEARGMHLEDWILEQLERAALDTY
jgi:hypothetical protein